MNPSASNLPASPPGSPPSRFAAEAEPPLARRGDVGSPRSTWRRAATWLPVLLAAAGLALTTWSVVGGTVGSFVGSQRDGDTAALADALTLGNRLARRGDTDPAIAAYAAGWPQVGAARDGADGSTAASLAYNLGTTLHRAERLPEALLWYRRAAERTPADPWLRENLELVRAELAAPRHPAPGLAGALAEHPGAVPVLAIALAWLALALHLLRAPLRRRWRGGGGWITGALDGAWALAALLALMVWGAGSLLASHAPRPAILLAPCGEDGQVLPAGSEVWVAADGAEAWTVRGDPGRLGAADDSSCAADHVALVSPR